MKFILDRFVSYYNKKVEETDPFYLAFLDILKNPEQLQLYQLINDVYMIPPADFFTRSHPELCLQADLMNDPEEKRLIGALFGYLFKVMLGYKKSISKRMLSLEQHPDSETHRYSDPKDSHGYPVYLATASYFVHEDR
jgi:hypothetical protein